MESNKEAIQKENEPFIRLENISKTYRTSGKSIEAVKNVSLDIRKGEIIGIIGSSGAGKSTLVRCINLLEYPTEGRVYIGGKEITAMNERKLRERRKKIGMIFPHFNMLSSRTVFENIEFPLKYNGMSKKQRNERVNELMEMMGISEFSGSYPSQLSGGQKQRVAIARALANEPDILLSDESTSALDPETTDSILDLLKELNKKLSLTIVVITHEMQVVKAICDRVVIMQNGEVVERGSVFEIFTHPSADITKHFVESTTNLSSIYKLLNGKSGIRELDEAKCVIRLRYIERSGMEALVSYMSKTFDLDINIIFGDIELIGINPIGGLVGVFDGEESCIESAIEFLIENKVGVEVIRDDRYPDRADA